MPCARPSTVTEVQTDFWFVTGLRLLLEWITLAFANGNDASTELFSSARNSAVLRFALKFRWHDATAGDTLRETTHFL